MSSPDATAHCWLVRFYKPTTGHAVDFKRCLTQDEAASLAAALCATCGRADFVELNASAPDVELE